LRTDYEKRYRFQPALGSSAFVHLITVPASASSGRELF
jgi:hypothetical protein